VSENNVRALRMRGLAAIIDLSIDRIADQLPGRQGAAHPLRAVAPVPRA